VPLSGNSLKRFREADEEYSPAEIATLECVQDIPQPERVSIEKIQFGRLMLRERGYMKAAQSSFPFKFKVPD